MSKSVCLPVAFAPQGNRLPSSHVLPDGFENCSQKNWDSQFFTAVILPPPDAGEAYIQLLKTALKAFNPQSIADESAVHAYVNQAWHEGWFDPTELDVIAKLVRWQKNTVPDAELHDIVGNLMALENRKRNQSPPIIDADFAVVDGVVEVMAWKTKPIDPALEDVKPASMRVSQHHASAAALHEVDQPEDVQAPFQSSQVARSVSSNGSALPTAPWPAERTLINRHLMES
jgi:hypothetical protein